MALGRRKVVSGVSETGVVGKIQLDIITTEQLELVRIYLFIFWCVDF